MPMCAKCGFPLDNHCLCLLPDQLLCPRAKDEVRCMKHVPEYYHQDGSRSDIYSGPPQDWSDMA